MQPIEIHIEVKTRFNLLIARNRYIFSGDKVKCIRDDQMTI